MNPPDPVLVQRARMERLADLGKRIGYGLVGLAVVAFVAALVTGLAGWAVTASVVGLVGSCIVLPPAIVLGYAVRKADREDPGA